MSCYMLDSACRWLVVENTEISQCYVKYFFNFTMWKKLQGLDWFI